MTPDGVIEFSNQTASLDCTRLGKLFDRYYTVQDSKKSNGIGLSIAKQLVELNNGKIKSSYEKGFFKIIIVLDE